MPSARSLVALALALAITAACGGGATPSSTSPAAGGNTVSVGLSDYKFTPSDVTFPANATFTLALTNTGSVEHTFVVPDLNLNYTVPPDKKAHTYDIGPFTQTGSHALTCDVAGHQQLGMKGTVTVK